MKWSQSCKGKACEKGGNRARKMIRFIFLNDPSGCWEENGLGQGMKAGQPERKL